jgi:hypothetical protein
VIGEWVEIRVDSGGGVLKVTRSFVVDVPAVTANRRELHSIAEHVAHDVMEERPDVWDRASWCGLPETLWSPHRTLPSTRT